MLPAGWQDRLVVFEAPGASPGQGLCLEPHDGVVSKLVAHREKDQEFAAALLRAGLVDAAVLRTRIDLLPVSDPVKRLLHDWVAAIKPPP